MSENQRIKELRKSLKLNQEEFARPIGLTQSAIAFIESGKTKVTEQTKLLIIHNYGASREWLETGEGEMRNSGANPGSDEASLEDPWKAFGRVNDNLVMEVTPTWGNTPRDKKSALEEIGRLHAEIFTLRETVLVQKKYIAMLEEKVSQDKRTVG